MSISLITNIALANDKYRGKLRSIWIAIPADTSLLVNAIPANLPTYVVVGWKTDLETVFHATGASGNSPSNYALTGVTRIKGANQNLPENTAVNCLNNEEFFNQYGSIINTVIGETNTALETVEDLDTIVNSDFVTVPDASTMLFDVDSGAVRKFKTTLTVDRTFTLLNPKIGTPFVVRITQPATARTVTWFTGYTITWQGTDGDTSSSIPASKIGTYMFIITGVNTMDGFFCGSSS